MKETKVTKGRGRNRVKEKILEQDFWTKDSGKVEKRGEEDGERGEHV